MMRSILFVALLAGPPAAKPSPSPSPVKAPTPIPTPSIDDSISFLREKLETYGGYAFDVAATEDAKETGKVQGKNTVASFDKKDCVLNITRKLDWGTAIEGADDGDFAESSTINLRIPLKEMEKKVKIAPFPDTFRKAFSVANAESLAQVELKAKSGLKPIGVRETGTTKADGKTTRNNINDSIGSTYIVFADTDIATRAADALEHTIAICQKKKEKF